MSKKGSKLDVVIRKSKLDATGNNRGIKQCKNVEHNQKYFLCAECGKNLISKNAPTQDPKVVPVQNQK